MEIWSAGSKHHSAALKAVSRRQTHLRGQARQEETTSANGRGPKPPRATRARAVKHQPAKAADTSATQRPAELGSRARQVSRPNFHAVAASPRGTMTHLPFQKNSLRRSAMLGRSLAVTCRWRLSIATLGQPMACMAARSGTPSSSRTVAELWRASL